MPGWPCSIRDDLQTVSLEQKESDRLLLERMPHRPDSRQEPLKFALEQTIQNIPQWDCTFVNCKELQKIFIADLDLQL